MHALDRGERWLVVLEVAITGVTLGAVELVPFARWCHVCVVSVLALLENWQYSCFLQESGVAQAWSLIGEITSLGNGRASFGV